MKKRQIYLFKEDKNYIRQAILEASQKGVASSGNKIYKISRVERTNKMFEYISICASKEELDKLREKVEALTDEEFEDMYKNATMASKMFTEDCNVKL